MFNTKKSSFDITLYFLLYDVQKQASLTYGDRGYINQSLPNSLSSSLVQWAPTQKVSLAPEKDSETYLLRTLGSGKSDLLGRGKQKVLPFKIVSLPFVKGGDQLCVDS